jgi:uncharacterized membrane protein YhhN
MRKMTREEISLFLASALCFLLALLIFITLNDTNFLWEYPWGDFNLVQLVPILGVVLIILGIIGLSVVYERGKVEMPSEGVPSEGPEQSNRDQ